MIDTLRMRTLLSGDVRNAIEKQKKTTVDMGDRIKLLGSFTVQPYNANVSISTLGFEDIYLETSLPKIAYGHNVSLLYPQQIPDILKRIEETVSKQFGYILPWEKWEVQRVDPCYAWKFATQEEVVRVLRFLRTLEYPMKSSHWYKDQTITFAGRSFSITFYNKHAEFVKYGYNKLKKDGFPELAEEAKELSNGLLRYEVRLFKQKLTKLFGVNKILCVDLVNIDFYYYVLNACLTTTLRNSNRGSISDYEALEKLKIYDSAKVLRLFCFWRTYYLSEVHVKALIRDNANSTSIARSMLEIANAGLGIPDSSCPLPFDLSIPSVNVITPEPAAPQAPAAEQSKPIMGVQEMFEKLFDDEWKGHSTSG